MCTYTYKSVQYECTPLQSWSQDSRRGFRLSTAIPPASWKYREYSRRATYIFDLTPRGINKNIYVPTCQYRNPNIYPEGASSLSSFRKYKSRTPVASWELFVLSLSSFGYTHLSPRYPGFTQKLVIARLKRFFSLFLLYTHHRQIHHLLPFVLIFLTHRNSRNSGLVALSAVDLKQKLKFCRLDTSKIFYIVILALYIIL